MTYYTTTLRVLKFRVWFFNILRAFWFWCTILDVLKNTFSLPKHCKTTLTGVVAKEQVIRWEEQRNCGTDSNHNSPGVRFWGALVCPSHFKLYVHTTSIHIPGQIAYILFWDSSVHVSAVYIDIVTYSPFYIYEWQFTALCNYSTNSMEFSKLVGLGYTESIPSPPPMILRQFIVYLDS